MSLESVDNIQGSDSLSLGLLGVGDSIFNEVFKKHFQHGSAFLVDLGEDSLHTAMARRSRRADLVPPWVFSLRTFRRLFEPPFQSPLSLESLGLLLGKLSLGSVVFDGLSTWGSLTVSVRSPEPRGLRQRENRYGGPPRCLSPIQIQYGVPHRCLGRRAQFFDVSGVFRMTQVVLQQLKSQPQPWTSIQSTLIEVRCVSKKTGVGLSVERINLAPTTASP